MNTTEFKRIYAEPRNGVNNFYIHSLVRRFAYSDGVRDLARTGCYWLLDIIATELPAQFVKHANISNTCVVKVRVAHGEAVITAEFEDGVFGWSRHVPLTDLPDGTWAFFCADEYESPQRYKLILLTEY